MYYLDNVLSRSPTDVTGDIYGRERKERERENVIEIHNAADVGGLQVRQVSCACLEKKARTQ